VATSPIKQVPLRFGQFEADLSEGTLFKRGVVVRLENRPFQVLAALLEQPGSLVTREQLYARLWPDGTHVDFDEGLNTAVRKLRYALRDSAETPFLIETVPRKGYRFIAPVAPAEDNAPFPKLDDVAVPRIVSRRGWLRLSAIVASLICLSVAFLHTRRFARQNEPQFFRLSFGSGRIASARFTPDGQSVIYGAAWDGKPFQLFWAREGSADIRALGVDAEVLAISSSGRMALLLRRRLGLDMSTKGTLAMMSLTGGTPKELLEDVGETDWSPDGSQLAVIHYVGETCRLEYPIGHIYYQTTGGAWLSNVRTSPKGDRIAFLEHPIANDDAGHAVILGLQKQKKTVTKRFYSIVGLAWGPRGDEIWFTAAEAGGGRALFKLNLGGEQKLVRRETGSLTIHDISRNGAFLLTRDVSKDEVFGHSELSQTDVALCWMQHCLPTALNPDGSLVLLSIQGEGSGSGYQVYVRSTKGDAPPLLIGHGMPRQFSPDGRRVVLLYPWAIQPEATPQLFVLPIGAGEPRQITHDAIQHRWAGWFPDGKRLVFTGAEPGHSSRTWIQKNDSGKPVPITPEGTVGVHISPDSKTLAAISSDHKLWLYPIEGGVPKVLAHVDAVEEVDGWTHDGKYLFTTKYGLPAEVDRIDAATGIRKPRYSAAPADPADSRLLALFWLRRMGSLMCMRIRESSPRSMRYTDFDPSCRSRRIWNPQILAAERFNAGEARSAKQHLSSIGPALRKRAPDPQTN
jgi:DNA-binding winged helix-turn-helix (wHTH) protein/Tol biopolymer transport system component